MMVLGGNFLLNGTGPRLGPRKALGCRTASFDDTANAMFPGGVSHSGVVARQQNLGRQAGTILGVVSDAVLDRKQPDQSRSGPNSTRAAHLSGAGRKVDEAHHVGPALRDSPGLEMQVGAKAVVIGAGR